MSDKPVSKNPTSHNSTTDCDYALCNVTQLKGIFEGIGKAPYPY